MQDITTKQSIAAEMTAKLASQLSSSLLRELTAEEMELVVGGDNTGNGM